MSLNKLILFIFILLWPVAAWGHGVKLFASAEGRQVQGMAYFIGGGAAANCPVLLLDGNGEEVLRVITSAQGKFSLLLPTAESASYSLKLLAGPGHAASTALLSRAGDEKEQTALPGGSESSPGQIEQMLERHLQPLRQQLLELQAAQSGFSLDKILAGIGYIMGLLGLASYLHYQRKLKAINEAHK